MSSALPPERGADPAATPPADAALPPEVAASPTPPEPLPEIGLLDAPQEAVADRPSPLAGSRIGVTLGLVGVALALVAGTLAWNTRGQLADLERELVRRQQTSADQAAEARVLATEARDVSRDTAAKTALLDAKLAEVAMQRGQLDDLLQSLSRSRDENAIADIDAAIRVALQQSTLTGSAEPLVLALRSADERLARINQPRLERLRRAIARDLDRVRAVSVPDIGALLIKLDETVRLADEMPLTAEAARPAGAADKAATAARVASGAAAGASAAPTPASAASGVAEGVGATVLPRLKLAWASSVGLVAEELRSLVRVTRIDQPEAMLLSPEQGVLLRENLKLRLLNARLSVLSRQLESAGSDLQGSEQAIRRYFDLQSRKTQLALDLLRQVGQQSRLIGVPRPDETLAATAAAVAGR
ncbi:uroporphyrinogen-III C-methyltransferase [Sphaerotilus mobilis]|uniref:uroporphyrinogen-III C-methyltransferase n=1 Tax=Sphaerotilus mobilis TaxID=47994 RepID=UPI001F5F6513|nr:uroporphyrinogen-III C-methyltransferase [Sphaerotilus mobilis]